ncbi:MAG: hypothetical protein Q9169_007710 [Polycauliona sp. 2 TL-2023]
MASNSTDHSMLINAYIQPSSPQEEISPFTKVILQHLNMLEKATVDEHQKRNAWSKLYDLSHHVEAFFVPLGQSVCKVSNLRSTHSSGVSPSSPTDGAAEFRRNVEDLVSKAWTWHDQLNNVNLLVNHYYFRDQLEMDSEAINLRDGNRKGNALRLQELFGELLRDTCEDGVEDKTDDTPGKEESK